MRSSQPAATLFTLVLLVTGVALGGTGADDPAEAAARTWLAAADTLNGAETWRLAAPVFQQHISAEQWQQALRAARSPMGALKSRTLASLNHRTNLPGVPDGEYAVMQYRTEFERKADAVETVTTARQSDGSWRVAGYFIK
jgi:hypothetical protein